METAEFLQTLETEGRLLAAAAEEAGTDAKVPTCPEWHVRDLLRHTGAVHRWAASYVAERHTERRPLGEVPADLDGAELVAWYRDSHRLLVGTLADAAPDVECWFFLPAPSPLAFWTRRQAHETTVHRFDAESARGAGITAVAPDFATDGIDELLRGFHARSRSRVRTDEPRVLRVRTDDTDAVWTVRLSSEPPVTTRGATAEAECELSGTAEQLYLALWNRAPLPSVTGDQALAALWRETSGI
ncbi:maleylpyruvate isomerase family mycothiol-dependent enzyme [Streptomyces sp. DH10]|uniref:maleylpyruvate isomerase family mycothiol-dependent enzyme n=1 Tax=Streptomyces sp. DH10 TaxID=3040121 RepID=UPI0024412BA5|nr:maleylpyruvate isomerase family mycothiol-dependent enzyme [Streptomyces sp. DH10]MDG9706838.1 maleylpyruvate isomerase family mycothiol-dependent enzyme [Streptomyces sp. DH10]